MKEEIKNLTATAVYQKFETKCKTVLAFCLKCRNQNKIKPEGCKNLCKTNTFNKICQL